jgi:hypothetical protein
MILFKSFGGAEISQPLISSHGGGRFRSCIFSRIRPAAKNKDQKKMKMLRAREVVTTSGMHGYKIAF